MLYKYLPQSLFIPLFGDRNKWGLKRDVKDKDFINWQETLINTYTETQKGTIGSVVNHFGFKIMSEIDLTDKTVIEFGPGLIDHLDYNNTKPKEYILADINKDFLKLSEEKLYKIYNIENVKKLEITEDKIPLEDNSVDVVITFHQLEHIFNLEEYLIDIKRILKKDGILIGAVPTEGSLAWGIGRYLTSRKYTKKYCNYDYDKIICWEHPNFVTKIHKLLEKYFDTSVLKKKPFGFLPFDCNLSYSFILKNNKK